MQKEEEKERKGRKRRRESSPEILCDTALTS
jgi:hypothetical protein